MHQAAKLKLSKHISSEEIKEKIASLVKNLGWKQEHQSWVVVKWKDWPLDLKCWTIHQLWYLMNLPLAWMLSMPCICSSYWKSWLKKGEPLVSFFQVFPDMTTAWWPLCNNCCVTTTEWQPLCNKMTIYCVWPLCELPRERLLCLNDRNLMFWVNDRHDINYGPMRLHIWRAA